MNKFWPTKKLGEYLKEKRIKNMKNKKFPVYSVSNIYGFILSEKFFDKRVYSKNLQNYKLVEKGDFAYNPARINVGSLGLFIKDETGLVSPMYVVFRISKPAELLPQFLLLLLKSKKYMEEIKRISMSRGSVRRILAFEDLCNFEIPLPPLSEQQKIVYILDSIQEAVGVQDKIIEKTKELKRSLMYKLFREGTRGAKLKKTEIGEIPADWKVVRLGDEKIAKIIMGQSPPSKFYNIAKIGLPFLQGKAEFGEVHPKPVKYCSKPIRIAERGDILLSVRAPVGDVNLTNQKYCIGRGLAAIKPREKINEIFLFYYFLLNKNRFINEATGSTFKAIGKTILKNFQIPLPPLAEQCEIVEILQTVDQKIEIEKKKKELYEDLFKTMLNQLMTGKIRVKDINFGK